MMYWIKEHSSVCLFVRHSTKMNARNYEMNSVFLECNEITQVDGSSWFNREFDVPSAIMNRIHTENGKGFRCVCTSILIFDWSPFGGYLKMKTMTKRFSSETSIERWLFLELETCTVIHFKIQRIFPICSLYFHFPWSHTNSDRTQIRHWDRRTHGFSTFSQVKSQSNA